MPIEYLEINNFETIAVDASSSIKEKESSYNHVLAYEFDVNLIYSAISDVTNEAQLWAAKECPIELHFNHGSYIGDGLDHIIEELRNKPSSNRALFSLISQRDISNSGDEPIPSFMIFQTCIDSNILYCTAYFRALEVSTFLRINIEELRLKLIEIYQKIPNFTKVRLVIIAFRGYNNPFISPLKKAKIDLMTDIDICTGLQENPAQFCDLIREKAKESTVIYLGSLYALKESLDKTKQGDLLPNIKLIKSLVDESIENGGKLKIIRTKQSHHELVDRTKDQFTHSLNLLASEFGKCL